MTSPGPAAAAPALGPTRWALMYGNFVIGCGVMVVAGSLNDLVRSLQVSVALGGQLITVAAAMMAFGAPLLAAWLGGFDRRRLLALALLWYALGHALSALAPNYALLTPVRAASVLAAAVFTPQAAAAIGVMAPPAERGRAITFVFLGWSISSVLGMPLHAFIGETFGWRWAFGLVALLAIAGAAWVWAVVPDGIKPPPLDLAAWRKVFTHPALMAVIAVTAMSSAGQFTLFSYFAPYYREVIGASAAQISLLFGWFGLCELIGNVLISRTIDRVGAARAVWWMLALMALSLLAWPLATSVALMALVMTPWGLGCFSANSGQQARLGIAAPALASALMALNTSAIYLGQAIGAASGGALLASPGAEVRGAEAYGALSWVGLAWMLAAMALSAWAARRMLPPPAAAREVSRS